MRMTVVGHPADKIRYHQLVATLQGGWRPGGGGVSSGNSGCGCRGQNGNGFRGGPGRRLSGRGVKVQKRFPNRLGQQLAHGPFAMEFHLALGRVDVHVHFRRIDFQKQTANRIAVFHQRGMIAFQQREIDAAIFHRPAVDEHMLVRARGPGDARRADEAPDAQAAMWRVPDLRSRLGARSPRRAGPAEIAP